MTLGHGGSFLTPEFVSCSSHISTAIDKVNVRVMGYGSLVARPFDPSINLLFIVVATLSTASDKHWVQKARVRG